MLLTEQKPLEEEPLVLRSVQLPTAGAGEIRVKVKACGVCRTDIHIIEGDLPLHRMPIIPGHQIVGEIEQIGAGVTRFAMGERVGAGWLRHVDGTCPYCRRGRENLCSESRYTGYDSDGGYAEYAVIPADFAYRLPGNLTDEQAAPLLCAGLIGYRALERAAVPQRGRLLLVGFGSSAHLAIQIALHRGHEIFVITRNERHIRQARALGASWAGDDFSRLPAKADGAILFAPNGELLPPVMEHLAPGGICSIAGIHLSIIPKLDYRRHLFFEREIRSVTANTRADAQALLAEAAAYGIVPQTSSYPLPEAGRALLDVKESRTVGTPVLIP